LAQMEPEQMRKIVSTAGMPAHTEYSITNIEDLEKELELIQSRGYSIDEQEQELGVRCFAVAVPDTPTPLAISVSGPSSRVGEQFAARAVPLLKRVAQDVSAEL